MYSNCYRICTYIYPVLGMPVEPCSDLEWDTVCYADADAKSEEQLLPKREEIEWVGMLICVGMV